MPKTPRIEIEYCTQCRWLLRASWMAQELLTTFSTEIGELTLVPGTGGIFEIRIDDDTVWSRAEKGRFPEIKELKQLVRDRIAPGRDWRHNDYFIEFQGADCWMNDAATLSDLRQANQAEQERSAN